MYVGGFGGVIFTVSSQQVLTFKNLQRKTKSRWHTHEILGATSKLEYIGTEPISVSFEVQLLKQLGADVVENLKTLRECCSKGIADYLVLGGEVISLFVLESVEEGDYYFSGNNEPFMCNVKLSLREYCPTGDF